MYTLAYRQILCELAAGGLLVSLLVLLGATHKHQRHCSSQLGAAVHDAGLLAIFWRAL
jgi:hypothetical protein